MISYDWAQSPNDYDSIHIEDVVRNMIEKNSMMSRLRKGSIYFPKSNDYKEVYTIHDAVTNVCIELDLSDEEFAPHLDIDEFEVTIWLQ